LTRAAVRRHFVQSAKFAEAHGGRRTDLSIYVRIQSDQLALCKMNLAIVASIQYRLNSEGSFKTTPQGPQSRFILANPPSTQRLGGERLREDVRWK